MVKKPWNYGKNQVRIILIANEKLFLEFSFVEKERWELFWTRNHKVEIWQKIIRKNGQYIVE